MRRPVVILALALAASIGTGASASAHTTERVSVSDNGDQGDRDSYSGYASWSISADGRFVAFESSATNLVRGDTNSYADVFVRDLLRGTTTRVSVDSTGMQANWWSGPSSISAGGRYVAFHSLATNLVNGDTNECLDVFVHDLQAGTTVRASVDSEGIQGDASSTYPSISADGRHVAFESWADNLVSVPSGGTEDIFVHDLQAGTTTRASVDSSGNPGNGDSRNPSLSADGRYVAFESTASNLSSGGHNAYEDIFVHDRQTGTTELVSADPSGSEGNGRSHHPSISADGRYVAFESYASDLVSGDTNMSLDAFVRDRANGTTIRVSVDSSGNQGDDQSGLPSISADGRLVAFVSLADNLVSGDTNGVADVFVHDLETGATVRLSVASLGGEADGRSVYPSFSADGRFVAFESEATNLVSGDTNSHSDVFVRGPLDWCLFCNGFESGTTAAWSTTTP